MILKEDVDNCQTTADTEGKYKHDKVINDDALGIRFARLAVVLGVAILAFDMAHHFRSDRAAPPGVVDRFGVGLSALGARGVLSLGLHEIFSD